MRIHKQISVVLGVVQFEPFRIPLQPEFSVNAQHNVVDLHRKRCRGVYRAGNPIIAPHSFAGLSIKLGLHLVGYSSCVDRGFGHRHDQADEARSFRTAGVGVKDISNNKSSQLVLAVAQWPHR